MEIVFKSPTRPQSLLHLDDSLAQRPWETSSALLCAIRDATFATYLSEEHRSFLLASFQALQIQESFFRKGLKTFDYHWVPTPKEEGIIQAAWHGYYPIDDIEGAFCIYGGLYGIVALVVAFRDPILRQWAAIKVKATQQWLVSNVAQLFGRQKNEWIDNFIPNGPYDPYPLQYLGRHAGRRKLRVSQARSPLLHQSSSPRKKQKLALSENGIERVSCQQPPTPTSITSSPDIQPQHRQVLDNKRPEWDEQSFRFQQGLPSPRSITSPPVQGLPEHQQLQEKHHNERGSSPTQQCMPTPTSNASPSGQDPNLFCHFPDAVDPGLKERKQHRWSPTPISLERLKTNDTHARVEAAEATPSNGLGVVLSRAISPQPRWSEQGVFREVTPHDAGLHRTLATKISGDQAPEQLQVALAHQKSTLLRKGFVSDRSRVSHSPSPPQALLVSEKLFYNIRVYFEGTCQNMILDDRGALLTPNDLCNDFDSYCFTATMLKEKGLHVEFRRALSKAFDLIEQILRAEHPRTLACFLEVFIHLIQTGLPDVTSSLRYFIKEMSAKATKKGYPWGQICWLLGELDSESLGQAMAQIWKCTTDTFDSELGTFSRLAVSVRLDYIKRVYGITNCPEEERLLRDLLAQFEGIPRPPPPRVMLNLAHNLNRQGRHSEAEGMALEVFSLLQEHEIVERIEFLKIVSRSQFNQGKTLPAEQTMRRAIQMIVDQWGKQHSWVPEFMNVLEGWLRGWGREEDANTLRGEIEELMGKDEIDEQPNGVQGLLC